MGWIKEIEREDNGAKALFWEVLSVVYMHKEQQSNLTVGGWITKNAYDSGLSPIIVKEWVIPSGLAPELAAGAVLFVSGFAKAQPEFEGWTNE